MWQLSKKLDAWALGEACEPPKRKVVKLADLEEAPRLKSTGKKIDWAASTTAMQVPSMWNDTFCNVRLMDYGLVTSRYISLHLPQDVPEVI